MGEGGQDLKGQSSEDVKEVQLPEVHKSLLSPNLNGAELQKPPSSLFTESFSGSTGNTGDQFNGKFPIPESPVVCAVQTESHLSTPSNSPAIWRHPVLGQSSSVSNMQIDYMNNQGFPLEDVSPCFYYSPHVSSTTIANTSNFKGTDSASLILPPARSLDTKSNFTDSTSAIVAFCRICHMPGDESEILISPCRCAGTLQFIHNTCLMKWLEITSKHSKKAPKCELCHFQYLRHKKFKFTQFRCPKISRQDRVLHIIFIIMVVLMIGCAIATVMCFLSDKGQISKFPRNKVDLTTEEIITLSCGVLFFISFFVAMSVQIKAKHTVYQLFLKFIMQNMEWEIDEYDKFKDSYYLEKLQKNNNCKSPPAYV